MRVGIVRTKVQGLHILGDCSIDILLGRERVSEDNVCAKIYFTNSPSVFCAIRSPSLFRFKSPSVADALGDVAQLAAQLAEVVGADANALSRVLRHRRKHAEVISPRGRWLHRLDDM